MSFVAWYRSQWTRSRPLQQPPYLARTDTNIARVATAIHNQNQAAGDPANQGKDKKPQDALFGPNIGVVSSGPAWTAATEKKVLTDELTPEIVSGWVEKSKDASQPTTTLQALVNLKRPTIRLSPLTSEDSAPNENDPHHHHHGLEFEYDCDAPKCGIYVHVYLPKDHPDAPATAAPSGHSKLLVFESVVTGGFGKLLKLDDGAVLELGRFERISCDPSTIPGDTNVANAGGENVEAAASGDGVPPSNTEGSPGSGARGNRRRFTHFHFRRRSEIRSVAGPALAIVDAEPPTPAAQNESAKNKDDAAEGVKLTIRLAALDDQGTELASLNEQITYLHIVRFGTRTDAEHEDDTRPWVVKVVKREATIGPHTFHLHEIYGLTSASTAHTHAPTAPLPPDAEEAHTYPPPGTTPTVAETPVPIDEDPSSECLLCLSSPREVVLLPCRHLVACKDCALNMVEFGAGGNITQAEEPVPGAAEDAGPTTEAAVGEGPSPAASTPVVTTPAVPAAPRRKRRAKGWFCPVCRQPYTSLLRITTAPPPPASTHATEDDPKEEAAEEQSTENSATGPVRNSTLSSLTPAFLRGITLNGRSPASDVEAQAGTTRAGT